MIGEGAIASDHAGPVSDSNTTPHSAFFRSTGHGKRGWPQAGHRHGHGRGHRVRSRLMANSPLVRGTEQTRWLVGGAERQICLRSGQAAAPSTRKTGHGDPAQSPPSQRLAPRRLTAEPCNKEGNRQCVKQDNQHQHDCRTSGDAADLTNVVHNLENPWSERQPVLALF